MAISCWPSEAPSLKQPNSWPKYTQQTSHPKHDLPICIFKKSFLWIVYHVEQSDFLTHLLHSIINCLTCTESHMSFWFIKLTLNSKLSKGLAFETTCPHHTSYYIMSRDRHHINVFIHTDILQLSSHAFTYGTLYDVIGVIHACFHLSPAVCCSYDAHVSTCVLVCVCTL